MREMRDNLSRYRDELKGFAILWIVLFHLKKSVGGAAYEFTKIGYGGLDMLMLLTGFGLYRSLEKAPELDGYLKRRAVRLLPAYLPFCLLWLCVTLPALEITLMQKTRVAIGNLAMVGMFAGVPEMISWYMSLLLISILLAPILHASLNGAKRPLVCLGAWVLGLLVASVAFWGTELTMAFSRLPIFALGMGLATPKQPELERVRPKARVAIGFGLVAIGAFALYFCFARYPVYLNDCGMYWYPFILIAPPLCAGMAWLLEKAKRFRVAFAPLRWMGAASFEIFLFNCWAETAVSRYALGKGLGTKLLLAAASVALGLLYHLVVERITKRAAARRNCAV